MAADTYGRCLNCNQPLSLLQTLAYITKAVQYALVCPTHGRVQANWSSASASAVTATVVKPVTGKVIATKHAAPV